MARRVTHEIDPDDIFLDSSNLPHLDRDSFEGRIETPVSRSPLYGVAAVFALVVLVFTYRAGSLQIIQGDAFAHAAEENRLAHSLIFAERGVLYDRNKVELAWNEPSEEFPRRVYTSLPGLAHVIGYVRYPKKDAQGLWWRTEYSGVAGLEKVANDQLSGRNGRQIVEVNARGDITQGSIVERARDGVAVLTSIDAEVQSKLYEVLHEHAVRNRFVGGASVIMDVETGEVIALTSFPEFSTQAVVDGNTEKLAQYNQDTRKPFLNRAISGMYTPGSIVKPFFALAALAEGIISPEKSIFSPGYISIPNPYNPSNPTIMKDWKAHGWTNMREAIMVSADVYFYSIGGGYADQKGLGISRLDTYATLFGMGRKTNIALDAEAEGNIPTPEWKKEIFGEDVDWLLGDTYNTSIGQYGFQVTPIQMARATAAIANGGYLITPQLVASSSPYIEKTGMSLPHLKIVREGMEMAVHNGSLGTARAMNVSGINLAGKTGTAEVGTRKQFMNSWVIGFWPADKPKYAFATVLEHAPAGTLSGAAPGMRPFFEWLVATHPEYAQPRTAQAKGTSLTQTSQ